MTILALFAVGAATLMYFEHIDAKIGTLLTLVLAAPVAFTVFGRAAVFLLRRTAHYDDVDRTR